MRANRPSDGCQSKTRPGATRVGAAMERHEQFIGWVVANARSSIEHFDHQRVTITLALDPAVNLDLASETDVRHGVVQEVSEGVLDLRPVDPSDLIGHVELDGHPALANEWIHTPND